MGKVLETSTSGSSLAGPHAPKKGAKGGGGLTSISEMERETIILECQERIAYEKRLQDFCFHTQTTKL